MENRASAEGEELASTSEPGGGLPRGATIGRYTIVRRLGEGGMGVVYLAFDPELDRRVAVKLVQAAAAGVGSEGPARLLREAQVMAKLSHPNVVTVYDVGSFRNDVFLAMEYVRGLSLREWCAEEPRTAAETLAMCMQAGRGLAAAHQEGILHRDFKPENIQIDEHGRARVLDFGLARSGSGDTTGPGSLELDDTMVGRRKSLLLPKTQMGEVVGTPAYMAPEQLRAMPIDARSDQFAFAITVYEALYGFRPFAGETFGDVLKAMEEARVRVPAKKGVPRAILPVLAKALAYAPDARWRSMDELLAALERAASRGSRARALLAVLGAAVAVTGVVVTLDRVAARPSVCGGADAPMRGVWDAAARDDVARAFRATGSPNAEVSLARVTRELDGYAAAWGSMSREACMDTRVKGVQSDEALDLRSGCLRRRAEDTRALAELLRHADGALVDNAVGAVYRLRPLAGCADVKALRAAYEPVSEDRVAAVEALRRDVANVVASFNVGRCKEVTPVSMEVASRARAVGYVPVQAEALYWAGRAAHACADPKVAAEDLFEAVTYGEESHQDELVARALVELVQIQGSDLSHYEEGHSIGRLADAALKRIGAPGAIAADLARARGWVEYTHGNLDAALPLRQEAYERHRAAVGDEDSDALQMRAELADLEYEDGHFPRALVAQRELLQKSSETLGPAHQRTGRFTLDVGESLISQGKYDEAAPYLERAQPIVSEGVHEHFEFVAAVQMFGVGKVDEGAASLRSLVAEGERENGADDPYPLSVRADLAKWLTVHRRAEAGDVAADLVRRIAGVRGEANPWYSNAYAAAALAAARYGKVDDAARAAADHAVALAEHGAAQLPFALLAQAEVALSRADAAAAMPPLDRARRLVQERGGIDAIVDGDLALAMARALVGTDAARARGLAEDAKQAYMRGKEPAFAGRVDAWLAKL